MDTIKLCLLCIGLIILLITLSHADEPSIVDCGFDISCFKDQKQGIIDFTKFQDSKFEINLTVGTYNYDYVTIYGKKETIIIKCLDKDFNWQEDKCGDLQVIRNGLEMSK